MSDSTLSRILTAAAAAANRNEMEPRAITTDIVVGNGNAIVDANSNSNDQFMRQNQQIVGEQQVYSTIIPVHINTLKSGINEKKHKSQ